MRKALKQGDLDSADELITQAEGLNITFGVLHFGDTPRKLRGQLNAARRPAKGRAPQRPSQKFEAELPDPTVAPTGGTGSIAGREGELPSPSLSPDGDAPLMLPESDGRIRELPGPQRVMTSPDDEIASQTGVPRPTADGPPAPGDDRPPVQGNPHLLAARKALAVGDVRRATAALESARQITMNYGVHDDTPDKVESAIRDYRNVMELLNAQQDSEAARHQLAGVLMDQAQQLMRWQDLDEAERLAQSIKSLRVNYGPFELHPDAVLEKIAAAQGQGTPPTDELAADKTSAGDADAAQAVYHDGQDSTQNVTASVDENEPPAPDVEAEPDAPVERLPEPADEPRPIQRGAASGAELLAAGEQALRDRDKAKALEYFREAYNARDQLDPAAAERLQDHLQMLAAPTEPVVSPKAEDDSLIGPTSEKQQLLAKQLLTDLAQKQVAAGKLREKDPIKAMELLKEARAGIESSGLDPQFRSQLMRRVDRSIEELDKYILANRAQIELDAANKEVLKDIERRQQAKIEVDDKLARLVDEFNKLMDEERYAEAEVLAKRARELDPDNPLVRHLMWMSRFVIRTQRNQDLKDNKEDGVWNALDAVETSAIPFDDREPYRHARREEVGGIDQKPHAPAGRRPLAPHRARAGNRAQAEYAGDAQVPRHAAERGARSPGQAGRGELAPGRERTGGGRRLERHAGHHRPDAGSHAEERAQPDSRAEAPELRDQGRSAQDHQRATARRRDLPDHLQRGRPGHPDPQFRPQRPHGPVRRAKRSATTCPAAPGAAWGASMAWVPAIWPARTARKPWASSIPRCLRRSTSSCPARPVPAWPPAPASRPPTVRAAWAAAPRPTSTR